MNDAHRSASEPLAIKIILRAYLMGLGAFAFVWAFQILPISWHESPLARISDQIIAGQKYKVNDLLDFIPQIDDVERSSTCRPSSLRSAGIIRLRLSEEALKTEDRVQIEKSLDEIVGSVRKSLKCAPSDSFLWLVLFWAETLRNGFNSRYLNYLRLSYRLGPYEGWIALKRSQFSLSLFEQLPSDIAKQSVAEFVGLVNSEFYHEAAELLTGPGWRLREKLLPALANIPERNRVAFSNEVYRLGFDVEVPGVKQLDPRPWQH
jgi:hypothetical protein